MKVLVTYGFHEKEKKFGERVCKEYVKNYNPNDDTIGIRAIHNSALSHDKKEGDRAYQEITDKILEHKPEILVDLHHNVGKEFNREKWLKEGKKAFKRDILETVIDFFFKQDPEIQKQKEFKEKLKEFKENLEKPFHLYYFNAAVNLDLAEYLSQYNDYGMFTNTEKRDSPYIRAPLEKNSNTAIITIEAYLNVDSRGKVIEDDHYYQSIKKLTDILHKIELYAQKISDNEA